MSFSQNLVLWLHLAFVIFTIGPVTLAIMSTPRYIRQRDVKVVRFLSRITFIFTIGSLGVLIAGFGLASMLSVDGKPWLIVSATLFIVAVALLVLIVRDQRRAIRALEEAVPAGAAGGALAQDYEGDAVTDQPTAAESHHSGSHAEGLHQPVQADQSDDSASTGTLHVATLERGRIAMLGGVVSLIWLVILVLMVWNS
jgi:Predicted integral membrane protein (DUF2269)